MKIMIDGVFYNKEIINFKEIINKILEELGEEVIVRSLEFPEIGAIYEDTYFYRCGFTLDLPIKKEISNEELKEIKEKIKLLFPKDTSIYSLNCEILNENKENNNDINKNVDLNNI